MRLVDGTSELNGRLEIQVDGEWGTVCDDGFDDGHGEENSRVICRELGFFGGRALVDSEYGLGSDNQSILLDDLRCRGGEASISACEHRTWRMHNCGHYEDVGIGTCLYIHFSFFI